MTTVLLVIHFFIAAFLVISILLQRSEGGALSGLGGGAGGMMTARGSANLLTRITSVLVAAFFISSTIIAIRLHSPEGGHSVLDKEYKRAMEIEAKPDQPASAAPVAAVAPVEKVLPPTADPHAEGENPPVPMPPVTSGEAEGAGKTKP